jgi:hypothetical protein
MKINEIYIDICSFVHTDRVREITVLSNGDLIKISGETIDDSDLWIVPSDGLRAILKEHHHGAYGMFFGVLLTALHQHNASMPIRGICMGDVLHALENSATQLRPLADAIASGTYLPSKKAD